MHSTGLPISFNSTNALRTRRGPRDTTSLQISHTAKARVVPRQASSNKLSKLLSETMKRNNKWKWNALYFELNMLYMSGIFFLKNSKSKSYQIGLWIYYYLTHWPEGAKIHHWVTKSVWVKGKTRSPECIGNVDVYISQGSGPQTSIATEIECTGEIVQLSFSS